MGKHYNVTSAKDLDRAVREQKRMATREEQKQREREVREARRQTASAIVNGQPMVGGMRELDAAAEEVLKVILSVYKDNPAHNIRGNYDVIPAPYHQTMKLELEKLKMYGMISNSTDWGCMWEATLTPQGLTYFEDIKKAREKEEASKQSIISIGNLIANSSNVVLGNAIGSTFSVDNSISQIEKDIEEKGGENKEELRSLLDETKELIENIENSRCIPKNKGLITRLSKHLEKHSWFYGEIVGAIGSAVVQLLGK